MITIKGYKETSFSELHQKLLDAYKVHKDSGKGLFELALDIKVKSVQTPANVFKIKDNNPIVSDGILSSAMNALKIDGFIQWRNGEKYYYLKNGKQ